MMVCNKKSALVLCIWVLLLRGFLWVFVTLYAPSMYLYACLSVSDILIDCIILQQYVDILHVLAILASYDT